MMRFAISLLSFLLFVGIGFGQQTVQDLSSLTSLYQLDASQQKVVKKLLEQEEAILLELESIKASKPEAYQLKWEAAKQNTKMGLKSMLTEAQLVIFRASQQKEKKALEAKIAELKAAGATKAELSQYIRQLQAFE